MVEIREAELGDIEAIIILVGELGYTMTREEERDVLRYMIENPDYYVYLAIYQGEIVGLVSFNIKYYLHKARPVAYIGSMVVKEGLRSLGIGKMLMAKVEEIALIRNCLSIQLNSNKRRVRAHEFYRKLGYSEVSLKFEKILKEE
ncbi:GNAT family N-acetyltransferase [Thermanaerosceptrum fracticalcis]|uniref:GNAT family N-acetyltransferase n=1 Tax=Thermanaerosceptrum fracticalcis TaxID=1712410 RepID=A0A7G6E2B9_THEFR|nr:GNAT family N-acetyltransferase [Thermanaerosceptrum fracticalcis]QNB46223.1 GNAT family N-acetyltransferase [Thermanaerosceptrum fracticalcis]